MRAEELMKDIAEKKAKVRTLSADELIREYRWYSRAYGKCGTSYSVSEVYFEIVREITRRLELFDLMNSESK